MADEIKDGQPVNQNNDSSQTPKSEGTSQKAESSKEAWKEFVGGKYETPEDLAKAYKELEKSSGKQSEEVRQAREFIQAAAPVFEVIKNDPELFKALEAKLSNQSDSKDTPTKADTKTDDTQGVREITSDLLIAKFEEKYGINKLDPEVAKDLRQKIGDAILDNTGTTLKNVDLRRLGTTLENAYIIAKSKSAVPNSETEDRASISSVPGSSGKAETVLTPDEAKVAEKMGLTREQYLQGKKAAGKV